MPTRRRFLLGSSAALAWASTGFSRSVLAQAIAKPARILVGFPPGGGADIVARQLAERLRGSYAPAVVVENRPGAGGRIAVEAAKNAEATAATILVSPNPMITLYPHIYRKLAYDPMRDLIAGDVDLQLPGGAGGRTRRPGGGEDPRGISRGGRGPTRARRPTARRPPARRSISSGSCSRARRTSN